MYCLSVSKTLHLHPVTLGQKHGVLFVCQWNVAPPPCDFSTEAPYTVCQWNRTSPPRVLAQKRRVVDLQVSVSPDLQRGSPGPNKQIPRMNKHIPDPDNNESKLYMYLYCSSEQTVCLSQIKESCMSLSTWAQVTVSVVCFSVISVLFVLLFL